MLLFQPFSQIIKPFVVSLAILVVVLDLKETNTALMYATKRPLIKAHYIIVKSKLCQHMGYILDVNFLFLIHAG